jgi:dTDP-4-dehydrorhamnose reductase
MSILLLGKDGQVGWELRRTLAPLGEVRACGRAEADLSDPAALTALVERLRPAVIVNAAAYTAVDRAESEPDLAHRINAEAPAALAAAAVRCGAWLIHYSTDYVFDGGKQSPYVETDPCVPLNVYGRSKRAGEEAVLASGCRHMIFRTSWVFGAHGANFLKTILRLAAERENLRVVADQWGAPTGAALIAGVTARALRAIESGAEVPSGIYHLAAAGETTWHAYARFVVEAASHLGAALKAGEEAVLPISAAEYGGAAERPLNSRLDTGKLRRTFGLDLPDWREPVRRTVAEVLAAH